MNVTKWTEAQQDTLHAMAAERGYDCIFDALDDMAFEPGVYEDALTADEASQVIDQMKAWS